MKYRVLAGAILACGLFWSASATDAQEFRRGDADGDGRVTIADGVWISAGLFWVGPTLFPCPDAADVNNDGGLDTGDLSFVLSWLFIPGSPDIPAPGPEACGIDTIADTLDCGSYSTCTTPPILPPIDDQLQLTLSSAAAIEQEFVEIVVTLDHLGSTDVAGWSFGICHDPSIVEPVDLEAGTAFLSVAQTEFFSWNPTAEGLTCAALPSLLPQIGLPPGEDLELAVVTYECLTGGQSSLAICDGLGEPPIDFVFVSTLLQASRPLTIDGTIDVAPLFVRGDCNDDGVVDVSDAVYALVALFVPGPQQPSCLDACDVQNTGDFDIPGPIITLSYLFTPGSIPPQPPFPGCGSDSLTTIGCDQYNSCP